MINNTFTHNMAKGNLSAGGAIYADQSSIAITDSNAFTDNVIMATYGGEGGAVFISGHGGSTYVNTTISTATFTSNSVFAGVTGQLRWCCVY